MDREMNRLLGFLGTNVDSSVGTDWTGTELVKHAEQGDKFSLYRLTQLARHSEQPEIKKFATEAVTRIEKIVEEAAKLEKSQVTTKSGIYLSSEPQA